CVKKGLLKTEQMNSRTMKYILTPRGLKEKTKKTLRYIKRSYHQIIKVSKRIEQSIEYANDKKLYLLGEKDEVYEIAKRVLEENNAKYNYVSSEKEIDKKNGIALLWDVDLEDRLEVDYINIIEK
ncbi:MAG: winged helix-turn-helix transcriptional regulator, partial [Fusobacteriota bacterium]